MPDSLVEYHLALGARAFAFLRLRNRRDELRASALLDDPLRWLPLIVQFPVTLRECIRGVDDRVLEEGVAHYDGTLASLPARERCRVHIGMAAITEIVCLSRLFGSAKSWEYRSSGPVRYSHK